VAFVPGGRRLVVLDRLWVSSSIENLRVQVVESPKPYTLHPTPHTLHTTPYALRPTPYTLNCEFRWSKACLRSSWFLVSAALVLVPEEGGARKSRCSL